MRKKDLILFRQSVYLVNVLKRFDINDCYIVNLSIKFDFDKILNTTKNSQKASFETLYWFESTIDCFMFVAIRTKPGIPLRRLVLRLSKPLNQYKIKTKILSETVRVFHCQNLMISHKGKVLAITTTFPERLDYAFIRLVKIGIKVNFTMVVGFQICELFISLYFFKKNLSSLATSKLKKIFEKI